MSTTTPIKRLRGFAAMDPALQREIAGRGGRAVSPENRTFTRDPKLAARAGAIGGRSGRQKKAD